MGSKNQESPSSTAPGSVGPARTQLSNAGCDGRGSSPDVTVDAEAASSWILACRASQSRTKAATPIPGPSPTCAVTSWAGLDSTPGYGTVADHPDDSLRVGLAHLPAVQARGHPERGRVEASGARSASRAERRDEELLDDLVDAYARGGRATGDGRGGGAR